MKERQTMAIKQGISLPDFFKQVQACEGNVYFVTDEGDTINLKSQLCQYLFTAAFLKKDLTLDGKIVCEMDKDYNRLEPFML